MPASLTRFPIHWIVENRRVEEAVVRGVWLLVPLEYYVLTRLPGGFLASDYLPAAAMAVSCIAAVFALSAVLALVYPPGPTAYEQRVRNLSVALIVTWGVTLALLALSYFLGSLMGLPGDLVAHLVYRGMDISRADDIPALAIAINFIWAIIAIVSIIILSSLWKWRYGVPREQPVELNIFVVAGINAVLMAGLHGATFYGFL